MGRGYETALEVPLPGQSHRIVWCDPWAGIIPSPVPGPRDPNQPVLPGKADDLETQVASAWARDLQGTGD